MKRFMIAAAALAFAHGTPALSSSLPRLHKGEGYDKVRGALLHQGWQPMSLVPAGKCGWDDQCPQVPEVVSCGVGAAAACFYAWRKNGSYIEIEGGGEGQPQSYLATIHCRNIVRGDPRYPSDWTCVK